MHNTGNCCWPVLLWWLSSLALRIAFGLNATQTHQRQPPCQPGHYCPEGRETAVPCPRGMFTPSVWARDITSCISCPAHHYAPTEGLSACLPCGSRAHQPLPGQDKCVCLAEGQVFQASDGQCHCALGYHSIQKGDACKLKIYEICKYGQVRDQYGKCLDHKQWKDLCSYEVCASPQLYEGYDASLGLCVCKSMTDSGRSECSGWCEDRKRPVLQLVCSAAVLQLLYTEENRQVIASGSKLLSALKHWESRGRLSCERHQEFSRPVYTIQTRESGFYGFLHTIPVKVRLLILEGGQVSESFAEIVNNPSMGNHTYVNTQSPWFIGSASREAAQVMNPIACLHLGDTLLFTVTKHHYPQYDVENLFNTNAAFDWGVFRVLEQELALARSADSLFSVSFSEPGVYVLKLSSNQHKNMYVKVLPAGGDCYNIGPFFPTNPHYIIRMGITLQRQLLLRPDWWVIGGVLVGAAVVLCLCLAVLILFKKHGWPEKMPCQARYRDLQLKHNMDDYSSKGSRVIALKKMHRNLQAEMNEDPLLRAMAVTSDEFWDYEEQVNLEAFSSSTFYDILLKHSVSVTTQLGQLREEVKQLYQEVLERVRAVQPGREAMAVGGKLESLERQVEQEITRRKILGTQISQQLDSQLQILRNESQAQHAMHKAFSALLRECVRLLTLTSDNQASLWNEHIQHSDLDRVNVLAEEMAELVSKEAQRQACWAVLKHGTGARLLCPTSGSVLTRDDLIASDGSIRAGDTVQLDPCTGLIYPVSKAHMLLASGHTMSVPSDFLLHPETGKLFPVAGNVGFDPSSSTFVFTADSCLGEVGKWESPVLPFIPYPCHSELPGQFKLRSLLTGQKLVFGGPMCDYETGILVPILAVTIRPQTGTVYPLGGVHTCPVTRLLQPIQIGCPMLDPRTGSVVLITGVTLDSLTGAVLPVGGLLLGNSFIEPLSGRLARVGGGSIRGGKVVPHAGGFQALLDSQALGARVRVVELIRTYCDEWKSGSLELHNEISKVKAAALDLEQAWRNSQRCMLQLLSCLEARQEWAWWVAEDGGSLGEISLPGTDLSLPALPGLEYPDPGGSGLSVPVLGEELDWMSGRMVPLAGTMEDADGKGLVPIRFGAQTVDPVMGVVAPVVGARLDVWKKIVVPVTMSQYAILRETTDSVLAESLKEECKIRARFWSQQRVKEEELVANLHKALQNCLYTALQEESDHIVWADAEKKIRKAAAELQEEVYKEAQRRNTMNSELCLLLPRHVLLTLTGGDEEEWEQQMHWHAELTAVLNRVSVIVARQQCEQDQATSLGDEPPDEKTRLRKLWEQIKLRHIELDVALSSVHWACELSQLQADTSEAILSDSFSYRDYCMVQPRGRKNPLKAMALTQQKILPRLESLIQLLEDCKLPSLFNSAQSKQSSDLPVKQSFDRDTCSRAWTVSVPVAQDASPPGCAAVSAQSLKDHEKASSGSELNGSKPALSSTSPIHREHDASPAQTQEIKNLKETTFPMCMTVPKLSGEDWATLLEISPLFQLIQDVEQRLRVQAKNACLLRDEHPHCSGCPFIDFLDAQWDCEGELIKVSTDTLNPREFLVYQHGQFLLQLLHSHRVAPAVKLHLAASLPTNNYCCNAFRNSFYYQERDNTLYVRQQRLQSVGGFSLLLLHCAAHISTGHLKFDATVAFQRAFFKVLQVCLSELFQARLAPDSSERKSQSTDSALNSLVLERVQKHQSETVCENLNEVAMLLEKHKASSVFRKVESLLRDKKLEVSPSDTELPIKHGAEGQDVAPE